MTLFLLFACAILSVELALTILYVSLNMLCLSDFTSLLRHTLFFEHTQVMYH